MTGLLDELPDMVISGINHGANMGDDTIYSGTVAAATEGYLLGIPSIAVSLTSKTGHAFRDGGQGRRRPDARVIARKPSGAWLLNVNVPDVPVARHQGRARHAPGQTAQGRAGDQDARHRAAKPATGSARRAPPPMPAKAPISTRSELGFVSVTPLQIDLTNHAEMPRIAEWIEA